MATRRRVGLASACGRRQGARSTRTGSVASTFRSSCCTRVSQLLDEQVCNRGVLQHSGVAGSSAATSAAQTRSSGPPAHKKRPAAPPRASIGDVLDSAWADGRVVCSTRAHLMTELAKLESPEAEGEEEE